MAKISVVIPTYNRALYIKEAIDSALAQTHGDVEVIVVDDSSTDDTARIVSSYTGKVKYILQENRERGAARNAGIRDSAGEYVAFLDSDDAWMPDHLERCLASLLSHEGAGVAFSGSFLMDEDGRIIERLPASDFGRDQLKDIVSKFSSRGCNASSCLIKRDVFDKAGYFSEIRELSGSEDWEMWARMASSTGLAFSGDYTAKIRFHPGKSSIDPARMERSMKLAMHMVFANKKLFPEISGIKGKAYASLYTIIAVNYYAVGAMKQARHNIVMALRSDPLSFFSNPLLPYTYLRSFAGKGLSSAVRKAKWGFGARFRNSDKRTKR